MPSHIPENESQNSEFEFVAESIPKFLSRDVAEIIFESGQSLRLLRRFQPENPLANPHMTQTTSLPGIDWQFSWEGIQRVQRQAKDYELSILKTLQQYNKTGSITEPKDLLHEESHEHVVDILHGSNNSVAPTRLDPPISDIDNPPSNPLPPISPSISAAVSSFLDES